MEIVNLSGMAVAHVIALDGDGFERLTVVVKGTFEVEPHVRLGDKQAPVVLSDEYSGDPATSALLSAGEAAPFKPGTDVLLAGAAYPRRKGDTEVLVGVRVGVLQKGAQVYGDRRWEGALGVYRPGPPQPFTCLPLSYERAFGGRDDSVDPRESCDDNPVGVGFRARRSRRSMADSVLPNLESPTHPLTTPDGRPPPIGFGPLPPRSSLPCRPGKTIHWRRPPLSRPPSNSI